MVVLGCRLYLGNASVASIKKIFCLPPLLSPLQCSIVSQARSGIHQICTSLPALSHDRYQICLSFQICYHMRSTSASWDLAACCYLFGLTDLRPNLSFRSMHCRFVLCSCWCSLPRFDSASRLNTHRYSTNQSHRQIWRLISVGIHSLCAFRSVVPGASAGVYFVLQLLLHRRGRVVYSNKKNEWSLGLDVFFWCFW